MADSNTNCLLTTSDNPFSPFTEFDDWFAFDTQEGYHTLALLARVAKTSNELSDLDNDQAITSAIDEIVEENVSGMHLKVFDTSIVFSTV